MLNAVKYDKGTQPAKTVKPRGRHFKPVIRVSETGEHVRYESRGAASAAAPCDYTTMGKWLKDGRLHHGFKYEYEKG